ncbi:MOSC domain-containing protein [Campylobacter corcagiensis]|uniref:MOSC domain-containing protein n=1 Tax=Campylobacter corcagiensis TaxID=1448857 RepID=A0A7M1LJ41_9BACT|nr:MOSC domain-containing protein [Campylobacter corcagiensis]QKF63941.1 MOSC domain-containing protein [Campylobacter corcagiensis]QOQ87856.1 MOSC domain-containing protein [Campylobacter corcagiensis]
MIFSIQVGKTKKYISDDGNPFYSDFIKDIRRIEISVTNTGIKGDEVSDRTNPDEAVFASALSSYAIWNNFLNKKLEFGQMGENLTIKGLDERSVFIGDIHKIGSAILQVSQPRKPSDKLYKIHKHGGFAKFILSSGLTGWCYRVLEGGRIKTGDIIEIESTENVKLSIMELNKLLFEPNGNDDIFDKLMMQKSVSQNLINKVSRS